MYKIRKQTAELRWENHTIAFAMFCNKRPD